MYLIKAEKLNFLRWTIKAISNIKEDIANASAIPPKKPASLTFLNHNMGGKTAKNPIQWKKRKNTGLRDKSLQCQFTSILQMNVV